MHCAERHYKRIEHLTKMRRKERREGEIECEKEGRGRDGERGMWNVVMVVVMVVGLEVEVVPCRIPLRETRHRRRERRRHLFFPFSFRKCFESIALYRCENESE